MPQPQTGHKDSDGMTAILPNASLTRNDQHAFRKGKVRSDRPALLPSTQRRDG